MPGTIRNTAVLIFLLLSQLVFAQKEAGNWYFGWNAGLDFNSGSPVVINGGRIHTMEGSASISNSNGQLLFYTDGMTVWNRLHQVMPNGTGLNGHISSTQSAIIVPVIGDTSRYYVFTIDDYASPQRLQYSIVNMNLDSGLGDVEIKNVPIITGVSEKLTAVRHCNGRDTWIITHSTVGNSYYAFLVDLSGVHTTPVISQTGSSLLGFSQGYLKASPDGKKLASANHDINADISNFDNITGVVSHTYSLLPNSSDSTYRVYGIEFSPNGKLVYVSGVFQTTRVYLNITYQQSGNMLRQYDVSLPDPAAVRGSLQIIARELNRYDFHALQLAIDGKIYMAKLDRHLDVINDPNVYSSGCGYTPGAIQLPPSQSSMLGLPTFMQSYFFQRDSFSYTVNCPGNKVRFNKKPLAAGESFVWNFGDPASGSNNVSTLENPEHVFTSPGQHIAQLIIYTPCGSDTVSQLVQIYGLKMLNLGADTLICGSRTLQLNAGGGTYQYRWQDNSSNPTYLVSSPGTYWVEIKNELGCVRRDSIKVEYDHLPNFSLGPDRFICPGDTVSLQPFLNDAWQWRWQNGSATPDYMISQPGMYSLTVSNGCGSVQDEVLISKGACKIFVPTGFTPNKDGNNDLFKILGTENLSNFHLKIFNRWGEMVFETRDKAKGWDGRYKGNYIPGVYVYMLEYKEATSPQPQNMKGSFVLIR